MKILGYNIRSPISTKSADDLAHFDEQNGGWWPIVREGYAGAWQQNQTIRRDTLLAFTAVYACISQIASDMGKMKACLMMEQNDIYVPVDRHSPFKSVLSRPNDYQLWSQFIQQWMISKLIAGNAYILKVYNTNSVVVKMYVLDPTRVRPLITPDGSVYYQLGYDPLSTVEESVEAAPQHFIIHDRMPAFFHPLIGTSPIFACGLAAMQGHAMQKASAAFFKNQARPSGVLTAPGQISDPTAQRLKDAWNAKFSGGNSGMVAVLGDGLKFEPMTISAADAQMIEQLKWSGETVCSAFHMPPFLAGVGPMPTYTNIEALTQQYLNQCLQVHIQDVEDHLGDGLGIEESNSDDDMCVHLDTEVLLRMDTATRWKNYQVGIQSAVLAPNEARVKENLKKVPGGDTPYLQVQNYSLDALAKRDAAGPPVAPTTTQTPPTGEPATEPDTSDDPSDDKPAVTPPKPKKPKKSVGKAVEVLTVDTFREYYKDESNQTVLDDYDNALERLTA